MGEMSGSGQGIQGEKLANDHGVDPGETGTTPADAAPADGDSKGGTGAEEKPKGVATDVDGIYADGVKGDTPVFDVTPEEFMNNMKMDRRRLRFKQGSKAAEYMRNTKYNRPFWIRNAKDGYMRKISRQ